MLSDRGRMPRRQDNTGLQLGAWGVHPHLEICSEIRIMKSHCSRQQSRFNIFQVSPQRKQLQVGNSVQSSIQFLMMTQSMAYF